MAKEGIRVTEPKDSLTGPPALCQGSGEGGRESQFTFPAHKGHAGESDGTFK